MSSLIKTILITALLLTSTSAENPSDSTQTSSEKKCFLTADMLGYLNNLEYFNNHRKGILYLGAYSNLKISYQPVDRLLFSLGVFMRKAYGDKNFLTDIRPILRAQYIRGNYSVIIGELESENRHGMLDALIHEQYQFDPAIEEGFQIRYTGKIFHFDIWLSSDLLNTPIHREHLGFGNVMKLHAGPFTFLTMAYWDHYGGQLYAPEEDPVRDNVTGSGGIRYTHTIDKRVEELGLEQYIIASATTPNRKTVSFSKGFGSISRFWVTFLGFETSFLFYQGDNFETWRGNPIYHTNKPYYYIETKRHIDLGDKCFFDFGFRFDFVEISPKDYFDHTEHQVWVKMGCNFDRKLF